LRANSHSASRGCTTPSVNTLRRSVSTSSALMRPASAMRWSASGMDVSVTSFSCQDVSVG
jgi:hypothetical protein